MEKEWKARVATVQENKCMDEKKRIIKLKFLTATKGEGVGWLKWHEGEIEYQSH